MFLPSKYFVSAGDTVFCVRLIFFLKLVTLSVHIPDENIKKQRIEVPQHHLLSAQIYCVCCNHERNSYIKKVITFFSFWSQYSKAATRDVL